MQPSRLRLGSRQLFHRLRALANSGLTASVVVVGVVSVANLLLFVVVVVVVGCLPIR